jgi:RNA polymerase sigma-70 factor (ECF subfamily)
LQFFTFDAAYLERLRSGEPSTEQHFVGYFSHLIEIKLRSRLRTRDAIEDVKQETFARVLTQLRREGGVRQPDRLGAFVNSVCNNVLLEHYRAHNRGEANLDDEPETTFVHRGPDALSQLESQDVQRVVRQVLAQLSDKDRRVLQSVLLDETDKDKVCQEMGVDRDYLRVLVHRAKQSFRTSYGKSFT